MELEIKRSNTLLQRILEISAFGIEIAILLYLVMHYNELPDSIPQHFNAVGEIDAWTGKGSLLFLVIFAFFIYVLMSVVQHFPTIWNVPVEVNERNCTLIYQTLKTMLLYCKFFVVAMFAYITYCTMHAISLGSSFLFLIFAGLGLPIIACVMKIVKNK